MTTELNCIIMGAAGRDFHDFQTFFRANPNFRVRAFTATQIPFIESRSFPRSLAGEGYEADIPIYSEERLPQLIEKYDIDFVFLAYSDLSYADVMHKASIVQSCGSAFAMLGPKQTQLDSHRPVISVTAVRTGAGKSPISQWLAKRLLESGRRVGVIRHPMPYGDLLLQSVQKFATRDDLQRHDCTIEEQEEYEPYVAAGNPIFAGVDYAGVLAAAESESDVILWDGGNNDYSFVRATLSIVVADALRPGHEVGFFPGETNFRSADVIVINKAQGAAPKAIDTIRDNAAQLNPDAEVIVSDLQIAIDDAATIEGRRVLVVEDGPTLTHGGMSFGAGTIAADRYGASEIIDPRPHAVGSIAEAFRAYPHVKRVLPALGYSAQQRQELAETIRGCDPDVVIDASPAPLERLLEIAMPVARVRYGFNQLEGKPLDEIVDETLKSCDSR